jgi:hypothetical protein
VGLLLSFTIKEYIIAENKPVEEPHKNTTLETKDYA